MSPVGPRKAAKKTRARSPESHAPVSSVVESLLRERAASSRARVHDRRRARILKAAHQLYSVAGYSSVSMREVAKKVGFSAQAIYYYFRSKEAMFAALADEGLRLLEAQHPSEELPDALDNLRLPYLRYYDFSKAHPEYFTLLWMDPAAATTQGPAQLAMIGRMSQDVWRRLERCVAEGLMPADLDPDRASSILFGAVHGPAVMGLTGRPPGSQQQDLDEVARGLLDSAILGLQAGLARKAAPALTRTGTT